MGRWGESQVKWILDVDISAFFDTLDHGQLRQMLDQRIRDGVVRRITDKWLKAGVMDKGQLSYREEGTPPIRLRSGPASRRSHQPAAE